MKYFKMILLITIISTSSCKKEKTVGPSASLTIINSVVGSNPLVTNFSDSYTLHDYYMNALQLYYGSWSTYYQFGAYSGSQPLRIYQYPDTTEHSSPLFNLTLSLSPQSIHTLFLTGTVSSLDTLFTTDNPPYHPSSDSSVGIRFINLSPGSSPISVNIRGNSYGSEVSNLSYKGVTEFKNYPATSHISSYKFEIRDAASGSLISNYTISGINYGTGSNLTRINQYRYKNCTIALIGQPGSQQVLFIKNY